MKLASMTSPASRHRQPKRVLLGTGWLLLSLACLSSARAAEIQRPESSQVLTSDRIDGTHTDLPTDLAPIEQGVIRIQLRSTNPVLEVASHELVLWPLGDGSHGARLEARFHGEAQLHADIEVGGLPAEMTDFVELPEQKTTLEGRFEITREEAGYRVVAEELPRFVEVRVQSRLAGQMVTLCKGLALLAPGGGSECEGLERLLSVVRLPMPEAGETYYIDESKLTAFERKQLDSYLAHGR